MQWNAQSILSNKLLLTQFLYEHNIHVAIISETWLTPIKHFNIRGYKIERHDIGNKHNGVAILIRNNINYRKIITYSDNSLQNICVRITVNNTEISIVSFYCPTNCTPSFDKHKFESLIKSVPEPMIFAGDFNAHHTSWGCNSTNPRGRDILEIVDDNNLVLMNNGEVTTVGSLTWRPNALDLSIVSPSLALSCDWSVHCDPLGSYHLPVIMKVFINNSNIENTSNNTNLPTYPNFKMVDWKMYEQNVDSQLSTFQDQHDAPLENYTEFCQILHSAINKSLPYHNTSASSSADYSIRNSNRKTVKAPLPWWNKKCSEAVQKSKSAYINFKNNPSDVTFIEFKRLQALKKLTLKTERSNSWVELCSSFNRCTPLSRIWKYMRKFNKTYSCSNSDVNWIQYFLEKFTPDYVNNKSNFPIASESNSENIFLVKSFSIQELKSAVNSRKDSAFGLDGIPYIMIKKLSAKGLHTFLKILNNLWLNNDIPHSWKSDCLVPILKPDKPLSNPDSYRPIALTSCVGKIFEQLIKQRLEFYIEQNNILPANQFGFRRGTSARESICQLQLDIQNSLNNKDCLMSVFFDVAGAFNSVNIDVLCSELLLIGIPNKIVHWVHEFLTERKVYVRHNNKLHGPRFASVGVCQGGILSPLIFILYIRRLNLILGSKVKNLQFADDLVVYLCGKNFKNMTQSLNKALEGLCTYFSYLNLDINALKSKLVVFSRTSNSCPSVYYNQVSIPIFHEAKFLGVTFTHNLAWKKYVELISSRANRVFNVLKSLCRTSWGADPKILLLLYKSLIRSHFEYGFLCFAGDRRLVDILDKIQNKSLRLITGAFKSTPINAMQVECKLPPLSIRFSYLKERFLLKLYSQNNNHLFSNLKQSCTSSICNLAYILQGFPQYVNFLQTLQIHKSSILPCYQGDFDSKFPAIDIIIDRNLSTKEDVYSKFHELTDHRFVYADGSKAESAVSFAIFDELLNSGTGYKINSNTSIFTAEAVAILAALKHIRHTNDRCCQWVIVSDSMSVLENLKNNRLNANTNYFISIIKESWLHLSHHNIKVLFMWVPSHVGVMGNERVDFLARAITNSDDVPDSSSFLNISVPCTDIVPLLKKRSTDIWKRHWNHTVQIENKGMWYAVYNIPIGTMPWFCKTNTYMNRKFYSTILRLRFGHCRLNYHLSRLKIVHSPLCDHCNSQAEQSLAHIFFECSSFGIQRLVLMDELIEIYGSPDLVPRSIQALLVNSSTYLPLFNFINSTVGQI